MYCTYTLTIACMKMLLRNRQALFFSLFMPLIILLIFGSIDFDKPMRMHIGLVTHSPSPPTALFVEQVRAVKALDIDVGSLPSELAELRAGGRTAVVDIPDDLLTFPTESGAPRQLTVYVNAGRPMEAQAALTILQRFADRVSLAAAQAPSLFTIKEEAVQARHFRYIEFLLPGVTAMAIMQMSVFTVAYVFTRYREQGVLKRFMATPMRPHQFVTANIITRLIMALVQAALFIAVGVLRFHVQVAGAYWLLAVCSVLGALMFLGLGFTVSGLSKTIEAVPVLSNIVVFPMMFVSNVFFPTTSMPAWLQTVASVLPLTYFANAMRAVMSEGAGPWQIRWELSGMAAWSVVLIALAIFTFRFQEREGA